MKKSPVLLTFVLGTVAITTFAAGPQLQKSHKIRAVRQMTRSPSVNEVIQKLQLTYTKSELQSGVEVGAEYCMACHRSKLDWQKNVHAHELRQALPQYSMQPGKGVIANGDGNGIDDFQQGLDFNQISSVFDPYKPNAPVLSIENGRYYVTIGEDKMPVVFTIGGNGKAAQMFVVRVPVTDSSDHLSRGNYVAPIEFDERTNQYVLFNPAAWYDTSTDLPKFDLTTDSATLASENTSSFAKKCASCHASGVRDLRQTAAGEWIYTPFPATLVPSGDPSYIDMNHDGILDVVNVQCESCHGPGSAHILGGGDPSKITNPNDLDTQQSDQLCSQCHCTDQVTAPDHPAVEACPAGAHHETQADVASELSEERVGQTPDAVIHGSDAEDCIACHGPTSVLKNGGMTETEALDYFFTTTDGAFTADTTPTNTSQWPNVSCVVCHNQHGASTPSYFNSSTKSYEPMESNSALCGQCHGNLRFSDTDHLVYNTWAGGPHAKTQDDVAGELSEERVGQTPYEVLYGDDAENCIACHAPTAILANGGMTEARALGYFFTSEDGAFTSDTTSNHASQWPNVSCITCHDQHDPAKPAYFNSSTGKHEPMNASELCGHCHGSLRFADTDHLSYNIEQGTGGTGIPDQITMPGAGCTDCHMYASDVDGSTSNMYHGHTWSIVVHESDGSDTISCSKCHSQIDTVDDLNLFIDLWRDNFHKIDALAQQNVAAAAKALQGVNNTSLQAKLDEAQHNLTYAESDESDGFHNHLYLMSLLYDANNQAVEILNALK